ncbi:MAG: tRNA adenosine(34) deaminase TadA [Desulfoplanes sp.]
MECTSKAPPDRWSSWEEVMHLALDQAAQAALKQEIPIGAVLLDTDGSIIGRGHNQSITQHDPTAHAEMLAIREACTVKQNYRLPNTTLIVTLEPCLMCLGAIIHARIGCIVYGADDPKTGTLRSRIKGADLPWSNHTFSVIPGILGQECSTQLSLFFKNRRREQKCKNAQTASG